MAKIVKKCRRCGHTFEEKRMSPIKVQASNESYVEHRYCPSCSWKMKRAAAIVYAAHGDWRRCIYWAAAAVLTGSVTF